MQFFIKDNYYFDIDTQNQLRISGPENHLFLGLTFPKDVSIELSTYTVVRGNLMLYLKLPAQHSISFPIPIATDIRTLRAHTEQVTPRPTYEELLQQGIEEVIPKSMRTYKLRGRTNFEFLNTYTDDAGNQKKYGSIVSVSSQVTAKLEGTRITLINEHPANHIVLRIQTQTNIRVENKLRKKIFTSSYSLPHELFSKELLKIYDDSQQYIEYLIKTKKTSSFEYGTIFPRDWIESADLGLGDLSQETVDYMYTQSMNYVSATGEAWHENVIGQYKTRITDPLQQIDRKMVDIEPRYIMGMRQVSKKFLTVPANQEKLRAVSKYILDKAEHTDLVSFKKVSNDKDEYQLVGNWRDSLEAYAQKKPPIYPYDVNCVFYPISLKIIREYFRFFGIDDLHDLNKLIAKWDSQKDKFRLYHAQDLIGYALALHGENQEILQVAHLDESYDLFYGIPSLEEIVSFAKKVIDPNYFYTPVGPLLVEVDSQEFTTQQYHGRVIWPKQAAFAVAGLARQFRRGLKEGWPWPVIEMIKTAVVSTAEACFTGWTQLGVVPELYYYDPIQQKARLYTDQAAYEGQMSLIQLWSSVGCRRIMQDYASVMKIAEAL